MWKQDLAQSYSTVPALAQAGLITAQEALQLTHLGDRFKVRITPYYASLMSPSPDCPIRRQAIPALGEEDPILPDWATNWSQKIYARPVPWHVDAIGDVEKLAAPRLTHRYGNRAILHLSSLCAVYCRFCFRKGHLNDSDRTLYDGSLEPAFEYLAKTPEIRELILTGGDPLSLTDTALERVFQRISLLTHLKVVRLHSRMAVTLPARIDSPLTEMMGRAWPFQIHFVSHFNHPREWTMEARNALTLLKRAGIQLYNQNVLMAGINDDVETLRSLYQGLYEHGVTPFYLHHADWTPGTFQFRVSVERGQNLIRALRGLIPGPALPHYVLDIPQGFGKTSLTDSGFRKIDSFSDQSGSGIGGAVYEVTLPQTRTAARAPLYLDLFPSLSPSFC